MILDIKNPKDTPYFKQLQKASGISLISEYLPHLSFMKQLYVVNTIEEWKQIQDKLPELVTVRVDAKNGMQIPKTGGTTRVKSKVEDFLNDAIKKEEEPYFLCMEFEKGTNERINTKGGFMIDATINGDVNISHTGNCFDCRELSKGKAEHEGWKLKWDEIPFMTAYNAYKWRINTISQEEYKNTAIERMQFLISEFPERKDEIIKKMPKSHEPASKYILDSLIEEVLMPLYSRASDLKKDGLNKFDVELNVLADGRLVPMEICRPERFITEKSNNRVKDDDAR